MRFNSPLQKFIQDIVQSVYILTKKRFKDFPRL